VGVPAEVDLCDQVGVWTRAGKLASLGLYEAQGIVRHGMSLQVAIDRGQAQGLVLCGREATRLASLDALAPGPLPTLESLAERLCQTLRKPSLAVRTSDGEG
jgi:lipoate-protein ligase B